MGNFIDDICCDCGKTFQRSTLSRGKRCKICAYEKKKKDERERYYKKKEKEPFFMEKMRERNRKKYKDKKNKRISAPVDEYGMRLCPRMHVSAKELPCGKREECFGRKKCQHLPQNAKKFVREFVRYNI